MNQWLIPCGLRFHRPIVAEANAMAPTFAKVFKEMIVVTDPSKPLPRAAKGTVIRRQALTLYAEEIEKACVRFFLLYGIKHLNLVLIITGTRPWKTVQRKMPAGRPRGPKPTSNHGFWIRRTHSMMVFLAISRTTCLSKVSTGG